MATTRLHPISGGRRRVRFTGLMSPVRVTFVDKPCIIDFLEQCFVDLEHARKSIAITADASMLTEQMLYGALAKLRRQITAEFGAAADANPSRAQELFVRFMPFRHNAFNAALADAEFARLANRIRMRDRDLARFLEERHGVPQGAWAGRLVAHISDLAWMATVSEPTVAENGDISADVARLLGEEDTDDAPTYVPSIQDRAKTTYARTWSDDPSLPPPVGLRVIK